ncbi:hypothetical protein [Winogradskyella sp. MH6]|uniref:hypothetical protein n=1 Tax=Winogradskyella sp. MH6 TaxID=2929510 RepID=UPI001FB38F88|nr:hypothetical protein [Winogradskyella sp. MH6]
MKFYSLLFSLVFSTCIYAQVGINTDNPQSTLDINGNLSVKHVGLVPTDGTLQDIDDGVYISIDPFVSGQQFRLPDATTVPGRIYILRNIDNSDDASIVTQGVGVEFFAGNNSTTGTTSVTLNGANVTTKTLIFISDGSNWTYGHLGF